MNKVSVLVGWFLVVACFPGQRIVAQPVVRTNLPGATLFADSVRLGPSAQGLWVIPKTTKRLRLVAPENEAWSIAPLTKEIRGVIEDSSSLVLNFPYYHRIESVPFGASVQLETSEGRQGVGETPLVYKSIILLDGQFVVRMDGYAVQRITPGTEVWNRYDITLSQAAEDDPRVAEVRWHPPRKPNRWIDYVTVGTSVAAGIIAIHYKFKADRLYDRYEETTNPALRPDINRYDKRSSIALGVMEASLGIFAIRLILR